MNRAVLFKTFVSTAVSDFPPRRLAILAKRWARRSAKWATGDRRDLLFLAHMAFLHASRGDQPRAVYYATQYSVRYYH